MNFLDLEMMADHWKAVYKGSVVWVFRPYSLGGWQFQYSHVRIWSYRTDRCGD